jgi:hypothetical protein
MAGPSHHRRARPGDPRIVTDLARLAPRSAAAVADTELLRVARTDLEEPETVVRLSIADRIRGLAALRPVRSSDTPSVPVPLDRHRD